MEEQSEGRVPITHWTWGPDDRKSQAARRVTIELHLLSHHHRDDREGVHMPVGDISRQKVENVL